jgi:hypothetical protein
MSKAYAWRPPALFPILKASAGRNTSKDWLRNKRLDLYHRSLDHSINDLNNLCSRDIYHRFADNHDCIRLSRDFYHVLVLESLDGEEVAAAIMCYTTQCPVFTCPHMDLDRTVVLYPYWNRKQGTSAGSCEQGTWRTFGRAGSGEAAAPNQGIEYIYYIVFNIVYNIRWIR